MNMSASERRAIADELNLSEQYLYQCLTGRKLMRPDEAVRIEQRSGKRLMRWDLRRGDWHLIWPELIGQEGAPPLSPPEPPAAGEPSKKFRTTAQVLSVLHPVVAQRLREGIADHAAQEPSPAEE